MTLYRIRTIFLIIILANCLSAQTDSLRIFWNPNPEPDIQEYRLYRAVNASTNFQILQTITHPQTQAVDRNNIQPGNLYSFTLTAVDTGGLQSEFSDTVAVGIPAINWTLAQITNGQTTSVPLTNFLLDPNDPLSNLILSFSNLNHLLVSRVNNNLTLTPQPLSYTGPAGFSLQVQDTAGFWDHENIQLQVTAPVNNPPSITSTPITLAWVDSLYRYQVTATDPDPGDTLSFSIISSPAFLTINSNTGMISGIPQVTDTGSHAVSVRVMDLAGANNTQNYTLQVRRANQPPVITNIPNQTIPEGSGFSSVALDNYVADPDDPDSTLSWSYEGNVALTITITPQRIATILVPNQNWNGSETIIWRAEDPAGLFALDTCTFMVQAVNDPPQITSQPVNNAICDSLYRYQVQAVDPDPGDILTYSLTAAPQFLQINSQNGLISGIPVRSDTGQHSVTVRVQDLAGSEDIQSFTLTVVDPNQSPVISQIPNQDIMEGSSFSSITLDNYVADPDDPDSVLSWSYGGNVALTITISPQRIATILIPNQNWNGSETIIWRVEDSTGLFALDTSAFTVQTVNDPPQIISQPVTGATRDSLYRYQVQAVDPDPGDTLTFSLTTAPQFLQIHSRNGLISGIPALSDTGQHNIIVRVQDLAGSTDTQNFILTVVFQNMPPVISQIPDQTVQEGGQFFPISLDDYVTDPEHEDDEISWSYEGNLDLLIAIDINRVVTVQIPDSEWYGAEDIIFTANDPGGLSDEDTVRFQVLPIDDPPVLDLSELVIESAGNHIIDLKPFAFDIDNSAQQLNWEFLDYSHFQFIWEDLSNKLVRIEQTGAANFEIGRFAVEDPAGLADTAEVRIFYRVPGANTAPSLVFLPPQITLYEDVAGSLDLFTVVIDSSNIFSELSWEFYPSSDLDYSYDPQTGILQISARPDWYGISDFRMRVTDPEGLYDERTFQVLVEPRVDLTSIQIRPVAAGEVEVEITADLPNEVSFTFWVTPTLQTTYRSLEYAANHLFMLRNLLPDTTYRYSLTLADTSGFSRTYGESSFETGLTPSQISDASEIRVYPNPFRPARGHSVVVFDNLPQEMTGLLVYTPAGETVYEKEIDGLPQRRMPWSVINDNGQQLASGFYIYVVKGEDGKKIKSGKLAVIR